MAKQMNGPFTVTGSREIYQNPWISVREDAVVRPDGSPGIFGVVSMVHGVAVLPVDDDGSVRLIREFAYAIGRSSLEVAAGAVDAGEAPLAAAQRELREELGVEARDWVDLGTIEPLTTLVHAPMTLFLARGILNELFTYNPAEPIERVAMSLEQAINHVLQGEVSSAPSSVLILKAAEYLRRHA